MNGKQILLFIIVILAFTFAGFIFGSYAGVKVANVGLSTPSNSTLNVENQASSEDMPTQAGMQQPTPSADKTPEAQALNDPPKTSPRDRVDQDEQAEWEAKAGFIDTQTHTEYFKRSYEDLRNAAENGDTVAAHILGSKLSYDGDREQAIAWLTEAASEGSISAALELSQAYRSPNRLGRDWTMAYAWRRVAESMGAAPDFLAPVEFSNQTERAAANLMAHQILVEVQQRHYERYGQPLPFHPQPLFFGEG